MAKRHKMESFIKEINHSAFQTSCDLRNEVVSRLDCPLQSNEN